MSGPVTPPLEVTEVDGSPDGRPITKIVVSNGDLTVSGRTATIDTSGSATTPAGSDTEIQFNDGGAFGASSQFTYTTAASLGRIGMTTGNSATLAEIRALDGHGLKLASSDVAASAVRSYIDLFGENDAPSGVLVSSEATGGVITLKHTGAGYTEIANHTIDSDTTLNVYGNGAGTPRLNLKNDTKEVRLTCEDDDKLYVRGPTSGERFTFDVSSATGGITWPDGSEQTSAASGGVTFPLEADAGDVSTPSYSFDGDTDMGMYRAGDNDLRFSAAGIHRLSVDSVVNGITVGEGSSTAKITSNGSTGLLITTNVNGAYTEPYMKINAGATGSVYLNAGGTSGKIAIGRGTENSVQINEEYYLPTAVTGTNNYVLTAQTDGTTAWAAAAESLTLSTLQSEVAASSDFADFQSRIAAL